MLQESKTYTLEIILGTQHGELPDNVEQLISDQLSGELDEDTGLFCIDVNLVETSE